MRFAWLLAAFLALPAWAQADLAKLLREGGYVLYMRHTSTDFSKNDANMKDYSDCANQRPLTDKGRDEARMVAGHIKRLGIPIGKVLASPYCRTMETARLAFGAAEATEAARGGPVRDDPGRYDPLKKLLSTRPDRNLVVSSHGNPFIAVAGPPYLAEGEIAVVRPGGDSRFTIVGRIRLEQWESLK